MKKPPPVVAQYYVRFNRGTRLDMTPAQNALTSVCWYHGAKLLGVDERPTMYTFRVAIERALGGPIPTRRSWEAKLENGIVGMEVVG